MLTAGMSTKAVARELNVNVNENVTVLPWPAYSPGMSPIEYVWDALDQCVRQRVPVPDNIKQCRKSH